MKQNIKRKWSQNQRENTPITTRTNQMVTTEHLKTQNNLPMTKENHEIKQT